MIESCDFVEWREIMTGGGRSVRFGNCQNDIITGSCNFIDLDCAHDVKHEGSHANEKTAATVVGVHTFSDDESV